MTVSFSDISYEQGLKLLQLRKQALDAGIATRMSPAELRASDALQGVAKTYAEKKGFAMPQLPEAVSSGLKGLHQRWTDLGQPAQNAITSGLIGTGLGAATGLGSAMVAGDGQYKRRMLRGGLAGAALGGGAGLLLNPEIAANLQKQFARFAKPPAAPAAASATPSIQAATPKPSTPMGPDAKAVLSDPDPSARLKEIDRLQGMADSSNPELVAATEGALTAAGAGYGVRKLHGIESYDPHRVAQLAKSKLNATATSKNPTSQRNVISDQLLDAFAPDDGTAAAAARRISASSTLNNAGSSVDDIMQHVPKGNLLERISGSVPKKMLLPLAEAAGSTEDDLAKRIMTKGFRNAGGKLRNPRLAALAALITGATGAGGYILNSYRNNVAARDAARQTLRQISSSTAQQ